MTPAEKQQLKCLLDNGTVTSLSQALPNHDPQTISQLSTLLAEYRSITKMLQQTQNSMRAISRQIGEAKKLEAPIESLKQQMQEKSSQAKDINKQLEELETQISGYLTLQDRTTPAPQESSSLPEGRIYPDKTLDSPVTIRILNNEIDDWNRYVNNNPAASFYHLADWRELIRTTFGHEDFYFFAQDKNGKIKGILPMVRLRSRLFGDFCVSMPYFNYGGAIADHPAIEQQLIEHANAYALERGLSHVEYRDDIPRADIQARTNKVNMILTLPATQTDLWQSFTPKIRAQIKRPQRENPQILHGGIEYLADFYAVFAQNMRDLGTPVYAKAFFHNILSCFPEQCSIMIIKLANKPVAAAFLIGYRETLEIPWASTLRRVSHLSINMLMYWHILCFAISKEYRYFDFGRSSIDSGTYKFKKQWGAQPMQLYWHYWTKAGRLPSLNPSNPKYRLMINIWKRLPLIITNILGPSIVKYLP